MYNDIVFPSPSVQMMRIMIRGSAVVLVSIKSNLSIMYDACDPGTKDL